MIIILLWSNYIPENHRVVMFLLGVVVVPPSPAAAATVRCTLSAPSGIAVGRCTCPGFAVAGLGVLSCVQPRPLSRQGEPAEPPVKRAARGQTTQPRQAPRPQTRGATSSVCLFISMYKCTFIHIHIYIYTPCLHMYCKHKHFVIFVMYIHI